MHRPIGRYRRLKQKKLLTSLNTSRPLLYVFVYSCEWRIVYAEEMKVSGLVLVVRLMLDAVAAYWPLVLRMSLVSSVLNADSGQ